MNVSTDSHADISVQTRVVTVEVSFCGFRESLIPKVYADAKSVDVFVPLPGKRTLWIAVCSWWLAGRLGGDPLADSLLADLIPEPPFECAADGCEYETDDYGVFLTHDLREHAPTDREGMSRRRDDEGNVREAVNNRETHE